MEFQGQPMIAWTIEAALKAGVFANIIVSTDDLEIKRVSELAGAEVPFLRQIASDDFSPVSSATLHALQQMEAYTSLKYEVVVQLMPNCPLRDSTLILDQLKCFLKDKERKSLLSAFKYGMFNPWWAHKKNKSGDWEPIFKDKMQGQRSQDLPDLVCPSGATWISSRKNLLSFGTFYSPNYQFFLMDWQYAIDIDDNNDLMLASLSYKMLNVQA